MLSFEASGDTDKLLFEDLAKIDKKKEVFGHTQCGCCHGHDLEFQTRIVEDNTYYEMVCRNRSCGAKLSFGQNKKGGGLFPKRSTGKGDDRKWLPNGGWSTQYAYKPKDAEDEE